MIWSLWSLWVSGYSDIHFLFSLSRSATNLQRNVKSVKSSRWAFFSYLRRRRRRRERSRVRAASSSFCRKSNSLWQRSQCERLLESVSVQRKTPLYTRLTCTQVEEGGRAGLAHSHHALGFPAGTELHSVVTVCRLVRRRKIRFSQIELSRNVVKNRAK